MMNNKKLPAHIAFIMDGNGRWAEKKGLSRSKGHEAGIRAMKNVISMCKEYNIDTVSFFAFSKENWSRPKEEVKTLFSFVKHFLNNEAKQYLDTNYALKFIGDLDSLPEDIGKRCKDINILSQSKEGMTICIYLNYGGKDDIINACNKLIALGVNNVTHKVFADYLYTMGQKEPDLVVRTGGEKRLSNFMLYQLAYSELIFTDCYWPDFDKTQLEEALAEYSLRSRRFGA